MTKKKSKSRLLSVFLSQIIFGLIALRLNQKFGLFGMSEFKLTWMTLLLGVVLAALMMVLIQMIALAFPKITEELNETVLRIWRKLNITFTPIVIVLLSLAAGICEELLFRGILQNILLLKFEPWLAILMASVVFGLLHTRKLAYLLIVVAMGVLFGVVYYVTKSLLIVIIAHVLYDLWAINNLATLLREETPKETQVR